MRSVTATICGVTPLLQNRFFEAQETAKATRAVHIKDSDPRTEAERAAYRDPDGVLYLPGAAIARLLRESGSAHKQRGSRKSLKFIVPSAVLIADDIIPLANEKGEPLRDFEVDGRPVTIPATKGRIMRYRPRLNAWCATFVVEVDDDSLSVETVHQLLTEGGSKIGVGDFRPERGGPFGRFRVVRWDETRDAAELKRAA